MARSIEKLLPLMCLLLGLASLGVVGYVEADEQPAAPFTDSHR